MPADHRVVHQGLRVRLGQQETTLRAPVPLEVRVEATALLRRNEEVGRPDGTLHLATPEAGEEGMVRSVLRTHVAADCYVATLEVPQREQANDEALGKVV